MTRQLWLLFLLTLLVSVSFCEEEDHDDHDEDHEDEVLLTESQIWGFGFLAGFGISLIGFLMALLVVCCKKIASDACFQITIKTLFSLALGALIGDVFVHILPHAYENQETKGSYIALIIICSIVFFLVLERVFAACGVSHSHWHGEECHDDHKGAIGNHDHPNRVQNDQKNVNDYDKREEGRNEIMASNAVISTNNIIDPQQTGNKGNTPSSQENPEEQNKTCLQSFKGKGSSGYMNLIGSLIHNFMDGLALGVAFATGDKDDFIPVLVAIIAHEIPREMGDVAILMTNEFSSKQTILCNGTVNFVSLIGVLIGLAITNLNEASKQYVLVFVAGNFLYISADIWKNLFKNRQASRNLFEFFGLALGVGIMFLLLLTETEGDDHDHR